MYHMYPGKSKKTKKKLLLSGTSYYIFYLIKWVPKYTCSILYCIHVTSHVLHTCTCMYVNGYIRNLAFVILNINLVQFLVPDNTPLKFYIFPNNVHPYLKYRRYYLMNAFCNHILAMDRQQFYHRVTLLQSTYPNLKIIQKEIK